MDHDQPTLQERLKAAIERGELAMKPRWRLVLPTLLALCGVLTLLFLVLYVSSFSVFIMRQTGLWTLPPPRISEAGTLFFALPWMLIIVIVVCATVLYVLLRRFSLSYAHPLVYTLCGVLVLAVGGGIVLGHTRLHPFLYQQARENRLPFAAPLYLQYEVPASRNVVIGTLIEKTGSGFTLLERDDAVTVHLTPQTRIPREGIPSEGEIVVVLGDRDDDHIEAYGVRLLHDGLARPTPRFRRAPPPRATPLP